MATKKIIDWNSLLTGLLIGAILGIGGAYITIQSKINILELEVQRLKTSQGSNGQQPQMSITQSTKGDRSPAIASDRDINIHQNSGKDAK